MRRFPRPLRAPFAAVLLPPAPASWFAAAEAADIRGFVRDAGDGESLAFTTLYLEGPIFHVDGGVGVFGSYAADGFPLYAEKG